MQTRAAVAWKAGQPLTIETVDLQGPKFGEVLVEIKATGICHTDAFTLSGDDPEGIFPAILGHEGAGVVVEVDGTDGANVTFTRAVLSHVARVMKPRSCRKLSPAHAAALARGRISKKPPSGGEIQSAGSPIDGRPVFDTPAADRPATGSVFSSKNRK